MRQTIGEEFFLCKFLSQIDVLPLLSHTEMAIVNPHDDLIIICVPSSDPVTLIVYTFY